MADACGPIQDDEELVLSMKELQDLIKSEARDLYMEEIGDKIADGLERGFKEWEEKSESDKRKSEVAALKSAIYSGAHAPNTKASALAKRFGREDEGDYMGLKAASLLPWLAKADGNPEKAAYMADKAGKTDVAKALQASDFDSGGALIPEEYGADFIGYLYNKSAVRRLGARVIDISGGNLTLGRQNATATAYWVGEGEAVTVSEATFGQLRLSAKKLGVATPISNDMLRRAPMGMNALVRDDLVNVALIEEDSAMIRGNGSDSKPQGIYHSIASGNNFNANGTVNLANITTDLLKAMYLVESSNVPFLSPGWIFHPRVKYYLMSLRTDDGFPVFMSELSGGNLYGHPYATTKNIPANLDTSGGGNDDETEIYFGDFSQAVIGETLRVSVETHRGVAYSSGGSTLHGAQRDETLITLFHEMDFVLRHDSAFAVIDQATWGNGLGT